MIKHLHQKKETFGRVDLNSNTSSPNEGTRRAGRIIFKSVRIRTENTTISVNKSVSRGWANACSRPESASACNPLKRQEVVKDERAASIPIEKKEGGQGEHGS
jgi:hypothetical protein